MTQVIREVDLQEPIGSALAALGGPIPGALVVTETFDLPGDVDLLQATLEATKRLAARAIREANMAMLYHWDGHHLAHVNRGGVLAGSLAAPHLTEADVRMVLEQLGHHPNYREQTIIAIAENGTSLSMKDGLVRLLNPST